MARLTALLAAASFLYTRSVLGDCQQGGIPCGATGFYDLDTGCGVDPNDGSFLGVEAAVCYCQPVNLALSVTYTGINGVVTTESSTTSITQSSTFSAVTFSFISLNTNIKPGIPVTQTLNGSPLPPHGAYSYTYSPVTSIHYTAATSTVTSPGAVVPTTTTTTATVTSTSAIAQSTSKQPCTTGTVTSTASTLTITSTSTITPSPKTINQVSVTTVHASCIPPQQGQQSNRRPSKRGAGGISPNNNPNAVNVGLVERNWFPDDDYDGPPPQTTYTTSTSLTTVYTTSTNTITDIATSTVMSTSTPTPLTTTVCSDVATTQVTTPTATATHVITAKQVTVTLTKRTAVTQYPSRPMPCVKPGKAPGKGKDGCKVLPPKGHS